MMRSALQSALSLVNRNRATVRRVLEVVGRLSRAFQDDRLIWISCAEDQVSFRRKGACLENTPLVGDALDCILLPSGSGALAAKDRLVVLRVSPDTILTQTIAFPLAAKKRLLSAVRFGLSEWTPFNADEVILAARQTAEAEHGTIMVEARYTLKASIDQSTENWKARGFTPDVIALGESPDSWVNLNTAKQCRLRNKRRLEIALLALAFTQFLIAGSLRMIRNMGAIRETEDRIATVSRGLVTQAELTKHLTSLENAAVLVSQRREASIAFAEDVKMLRADLNGRSKLTRLAMKDGKWSARIAVPPGVDIFGTSSNISLLSRSSVSAEKPAAAGVQIQDINFIFVGAVTK